MSFDVAVVGAGIVGAAVARKVAREGGRVVVVDRDEVRHNASWAAAGMLAPQAEADGPGDFFSLLLQARSLFPGTVEELEAETGIEVGYRTEGMLLAALTEEDEEELERRHDWQLATGLGIDRLTATETRALEPNLSSAVRGSLRFPDDHQVDNRLLADAFCRSARSAGAEFRLGSTVHRLHHGAEGLRLELESGERVDAATVVLAAGCWSGTIQGLPRALPVDPVHGQIIAIENVPPPIEHVVATPRGYLVPRCGGALIAGTTVERIGFRTGVTVAGAHHVTSLALEMVPVLAGHGLTAQWAGLRPGTPDTLPILGPDPNLPSLLYATGHYRNGILLAPLTGEVIGDLALGRQSPVDLTPYRPDRFAETSTSRGPAHCSSTNGS